MQSIRTRIAGKLYEYDGIRDLSLNFASDATQCRCVFCSGAGDTDD